MIRTEHLTKIYSSGVKALDNLTLQVEKGEIFGFLGPNGAGKSTTIKILTTLSRPTSGKAWIGGFNVVTEPHKVRTIIGYVSQETGVDYCLTGRENLLLQGRLYRMSGKEILNRIDELLELFDLKEHADSLVSTYSGGMRRKLDIAMALIHKPDILFLDEPTIGLDPHSRSSLWKYIRLLNEDLKVTIFLTTHYLDEADKLSHRIGILYKGKMKVVDTPEALKDSIKGDSIIFSLNGASKEQAFTLLQQNQLVRDILREDNNIRVYVDNGSEAIPPLIKLLNHHGIEVLSITLSRPSLDDVYLKYTGVSFRESDSSETSNAWWTQWAGKGWGKKWNKGWQKDWEGKDTEEKWKEGGNWESSHKWDKAAGWNEGSTSQEWGGWKDKKEDKETQWTDSSWKS